MTWAASLFPTQNQRYIEGQPTKQHRIEKTGSMTNILTNWKVEVMVALVVLVKGVQNAIQVGLTAQAAVAEKEEVVVNQTPVDKRTKRRRQERRSLGTKFLNWKNNLS